MKKQNLAEVAAAGYFAGMDLLYEVSPAGTVREGFHGTRMMFSDTLLPQLNGVFTERHTVDVDEVALMAKTMSGLGVPWSIQVRDAPSRELLSLAAQHGLVRREVGALMATSLADTAAWRLETDGPLIRRISGSESHLYVDALTAGFGLPRDAFGEFMSGPVLDAEGATAYVMEEGDDVLATGFGVLSGEELGLSNITARSPVYGRSYGLAMIAAVLRDGFAAGATSAYLHASAAGKGVYRSLGFETVEAWTYLTASSPTRASPSSSASG